MKVVLTQDVRKVGRKGDIVDVSDGYGRNYLIGRGLAIPATRENINQAEQSARAESNRIAREKDEARELAARLDGKTIICRVKAGEKGKLYGSVSTREVADAVKQSTGLDIDRHNFDIKEQIRTLGTYEIIVRLYAGITATIKVEVVAEDV
ncbi:MAG: 50S ribosomal protein L9 [bacterium]|jgi:large subunit ribosomal protein L9|nr:50S ribosomal protein L9 [bacterium]MDD3804856.1 50S ribosomal protein L9 [bacterium]MDD4152261.1 50S ribosomal protein L9 [bacterium]MDD4558463.1 50S ribosomal protein L9 [bacterium]